MALNLDMLPPNNLYLGDTPIRAYTFFHIHADPNIIPFPDSYTLIQLLQNYHPLYYPYAWLVGEHEAVIVNFDDINDLYTSQQPPSYSSTTTIQQPQTMNVRGNTYERFNEVSFLQDAINESFEQAARHVPWSGLTEKFIFHTLRVTEYCEEDEGEICVVCQVEFERKERVGVLQCKHQYHPECIKEWLVRHNVCPLCKAQALMV